MARSAKRSEVRDLTTEATVSAQLLCEAAPVATRPMRLADGAVAAVDSPARRLQQEIEAAMAQPDPDRWPARWSLAFITLASGALWAGVVVAAAAAS